MFKMTKAEALERQEKQVAFYETRYPGIRAKVAAATQADKLQDGVEYDVIEINKYIPRGGAIEDMLGIDGGGE